MSISNHTTIRQKSVKLDDKATIELMNVNKRVVSNSNQKLNLHENNLDNKDYNKWLNVAINFLRERKISQISVKYLRKNNFCTEVDFKNPDFLEYLRLSGRLYYNEHDGIISLVKKYEIRNKAELINLLKKEENGLKYDDDLKGAYAEIEKDIEELKKSNLIKTVEQVLFYRDIDDPVEKILINPNYQSAISVIREIWKNECRGVEISKPEQKLDLTKETEIKLTKKKRKKTKIKSNIHLKHLLENIGAENKK